MAHRRESGRRSLPFAGRCILPRRENNECKVSQRKDGIKDGQYTIAQPLPSQATIEYVEKANRENRLWLFPGIETEQLTAHLRTENPQLECRSLRRGRLQYLSKLGYGDEELLHVSRHAGLPMLRRYLTFGFDSGENRRQAMRITELEQKIELPNGPSPTSKAPPRQPQAQTSSRGSSPSSTMAATTLQTSCKGRDTNRHDITIKPSNAHTPTPSSRNMP